MASKTMALWEQLEEAADLVKKKRVVRDKAQKALDTASSSLGDAESAYGSMQHSLRAQVDTLLPPEEPDSTARVRTT